MPFWGLPRLGDTLALAGSVGRSVRSVSLGATGGAVPIDPSSLLPSVAEGLGVVEGLAVAVGHSSI
jgi:hypothetical protein